MISIDYVSEVTFMHISGWFGCDVQSVESVSPAMIRSIPSLSERRHIRIK
jgi:hypothetical protein